MNSDFNGHTRSSELHKRIVFTISDLELHFPVAYRSFHVHTTSFEDYRDTVVCIRSEVNEWVATHFDEPVVITEVIHDIPPVDGTVVVIVEQ
jgi:hypothetical protein